MSKRIYVYVVIATIFVFSISGSLILLSNSIWITTISPERNYKIEIIGSELQTLIPFTEQIIKFNLYKNNEKVVESKYLTSFDYFDQDFNATYSSYEWDEDRILRFNSRVSSFKQQRDELIIINRTDNTIKYLRINSQDLILLFDIPSNSTVKLSTPHQKWQSWIVGEGEFNNGKHIPRNGINFSHKDRFQNPLRYCLTIHNNSLAIESPLVEGWSFDKPIIAKSDNCEN